MRPPKLLSYIEDVVSQTKREVFREQHLPTEFNLATYLARYRDIRDWAVKPEEALKHYLKHGVQEERDGTPSTIDASFIGDLYGISVPRGMSPRRAPAFLRSKLGVDYSHLIFLTECEMLSFYRIDLQYFSTYFDHEYYLLNALPPSKTAKSRAACLKHFCEIGRYQALDVSDLYRFDERFFFDEYITSASTKSQPTPSSRRIEFFQEWLGGAHKDLRWPNLRTLVRHNFKLDFPPTLEAQLPHLQDIISASRPSEIIQYLIDHPSKIVRHLEVCDDAIGHFLSAIGDRFVAKGKPSQASFCYAYTLKQRPNLGTALRHQADLVHRERLFGLDVMLRRQIIDMGVSDKWTYMNLAASLLELGDHVEAAKAMQAGLTAHPEDWRLRKEASTCAYKALEHAISQSPKMAVVKGHQAAQSVIMDTLALATPRFGGARHGRTVRRVAIGSYYALPQCRFYRISLKVEQLEALGLEVEVFDIKHRMDDYLSKIDSFDLLILHRVPAVPQIIEVIGRTSDLGIPTVYDIDDLVFEADHFPPPLSSYAGQIDHATHSELATGVPLYAHAISLCDYGLVSTAPLKPYVESRVRTGLVFVLPNALSTLHRDFAFARRPAVQRNEVVIFYGTGTRAHKQDFKELVEPALVKILSKHGKKVRVVIFGYLELSKTLAEFQEQVVVSQPLSNIEDYWEALQQSDINLAVLEPSAFNDCKSEIKWLEAAMMGIPSVLSRTKTYEMVVDDGVTGFLCDSADDFGDALDKLVNDRALRQKIGVAARAKVLKTYGLEAQMPHFRDIISDIENDRPRPKNRLLVVNVFYPPQAIGGATRVVHNNVVDLKVILGDDWSIDVISTLEGGDTPYEITWRIEDGVRVFAITAADRSDIDSIIEDDMMADAFERCLRLIDPTLVHFHCIQRLTVSVVDVVRLRKIPYIVTMHDGWWISPHHFILGPNGKEEYYDFRDGAEQHSETPPRFPALRRALRYAKRVTTVSKPFADVCSKAGLDNMVVIENGVSSFQAELPRVANKTGRVRLAHIGGTERHKGLQIIRNLLLTREFNNLSLLVIDHAFESCAVARELWGSTPVEIRGKTPQSKVGYLYAQIDVLLAPSVWPESFGLVTREAAMAGCWIVASDRGAVGECVLPGKNGFIVDVASPCGLEEVLKKIDSEPEVFTRPPEHKIEIRRAFEQAEELAELYGDVIRT